MLPPPAEPTKPEIEPKDLREAIIGINKGFKEWADKGLSRDLIVLMIHDACKVSKRDIIKVIETLGSLRQKYVVDPEPKK